MDAIELKKKGNESFKNGDYGSALNFYNDYLKLYPDDEDVLINKGLLISDFLFYGWVNL